LNRELHGVSEQIVKNLTQTEWIRFDTLRKITLDLVNKNQFAASGSELKLVHDAREKLGQFHSQQIEPGFPEVVSIR
jgi:hypothetical protein